MNRTWLTITQIGVFAMLISSAIVTVPGVFEISAWWGVAGAAASLLVIAVASGKVHK